MNETHDQISLLLLTGVTGPPGDLGAVGPKGEEGDKGFSVQGPPGFPGVKGQFWDSAEENSWLKMINNTNAYLFISGLRSEGPSRSSGFIKFWNQGTGGAIGPPGDAGAKGTVDK